MKFETLGDWCKWLERNFTPDQMIPSLPTIIRLDGNNFHNYAKGLDKPFDMGLTNLMIETTKHLVKETNAIIGYTQSDEITLVLYSADRDTPIYHDGKKQKILSKLTGVCVNFFNENRPKYLPEHERIANFDCRIYQVPSLIDACAQLLWRENDATKNSISMLAQANFSHKELQNLNGHQMKTKLREEKNIEWDNLESKYKKGTYVQRVRTSRPFTQEELDSLPPNHNARKDPDMTIERNVISVIELPPLTDIDNKVDVIFHNQTPITKI